MLALPGREGGSDGPADKVGKFFARNLDIRFGRDGRAEVDFDFA
jgi:hypothetical protein